MNSGTRLALQFGLPLVVIALGGLGANYLIKNPKRAKRTSLAPKPPLVDVLRAKSSREQVSVSAMGTVVAAKQVELRSEVSGRVVTSSSELVPGGRVKRGTVLVRVDPRDYKLAVDQQQASVERAQFELKVEKGRQRIATREWDLIGNAQKSGEEGKELALRRPHLKSANVSLNAAKSGLERAQLNVGRSVIRAPFNAFVKEEVVELGQLVTPQTRLGTLVGTDKFWVQVSVPIERLVWFSVPGVNGSEASDALVLQEAGPNLRIERKGRLIRLLGDLDPKGRMARVLVEIDDPFGLNNEATDSGLPLLLGAFVQVDIQGRELDGVFVLPRTALREQNLVWIFNPEARLELRKVDVAWRGASIVYVSGGLNEGDQVITTRVAAPVEGMQLRLPEQSKAPSAPPSARAEKNLPSAARAVEEGRP